jgi:hypothetical protein
MNLTNQPFDQAEAEEMNKIKEKQRANSTKREKSELTHRFFCENRVFHSFKKLNA